MNRLNQIKKILFYEWDPISINDNVLLINEYDKYALIIENNIRQGQFEISHIAKLLEKFETEYIGLTIDPQRRKNVAEMIKREIEKSK